jgi:hypothetical protein
MQNEVCWINPWGEKELRKTDSVKCPVYSETSYGVFARTCLEGVETVCERRGKISPSAVTYVRKFCRASCYTCPMTATDPAGNEAIDAVIQLSGKVMLRLSPQIICLYLRVLAWARAPVGGDVGERLFDIQNVHKAVRPRYRVARTHSFNKMTKFSHTTLYHNTENHNLNIISPFVECPFVVHVELSSAVSLHT